jgi:hypothetical protein
MRLLLSLLAVSAVAADNPARIPPALDAAAVTLAPGAELEEIDRDDHCAYFVGPRDESGFPLVRAECTWPDVSPQQLDAVLGDWTRYDDCFATIDAVEVLDDGGAVQRVRHVHAVPAAYDREVVLQMQRQPLGEGWRYSWSADPAPPPPTDGLVAVARDDGFWTVSPAPGGGAAVTTELIYNPGGSLPAFVVRWFQTAGMSAFVEELRACAAQ